MRYATLIFGICFASPAVADWQYTRWNMVPREVSDASQGTAVTISREESRYHTSPGSGVRPLLKAPYTSGRFNFYAYFYFQSGSNQLKQVTLKIADPEDNLLVVGSLKKKYGAPLEDRSTDDPIDLVVLIWQTTSDQIMYSQIGDSAGSIEYTPRVNADTEGL